MDAKYSNPSKNYLLMKWKNTDKPCYWFNYNTIYYNNINGNNYNPLDDDRWHPSFVTNGFCYPKKDLTNIDSFETTTVKPESKLYFDSGSGFPRFKLSLSDNKRCIKTSKADYIVVSGNTERSTTTEEYVVIEDNNKIILVKNDDFNNWYNGKLEFFINNVSSYITFIDPKVVYMGRLSSYSKSSVWMAKYIDGEYTLQYITDKNLDKIICNMCPEPTYEELLSIIDMLNSDDASIVQLGIKMLAGYNVDKYKLSLKLILCTRTNWWNYSKTLVATKQLVETLDINHYRISDSFSSGVYYVDDGKTDYTVEDIAIAKKLANKFLTEEFQRQYNNYIQQGYKWLPDEHKIKLV